MTTSIDTISLSSGATLIAPDVTRLTTQSLTGTGVFDVLMAATKLHLKAEYDNERITGQEYATVYLGALTAVMQQSVAFLLNHQQEEKIVAEIALVRQQTVTELAQTDDTIPEGLGFNGTTAVEGLVKSQKDINDLQASLVTSQIAKADAEVIKTAAETDKIGAEEDRVVVEKNLIGQKIVTEVSQTCDSLSEVMAVYGYNDSAAIEGLIKAELDKAAAEIDKITSDKDKTAAEKDLLGQKIVTELAQTCDNLTNVSVDYGYNDSTLIEGLVKAQIDKTAAEVSRTAAEVDKLAAEEELIDAEVIKAAAEVDLINQKTATEVAQTSDTKPIDLGKVYDIAIDGLAKSQKDKNAAEIILLSQKAITELAQTSDSIPTGTPALNTNTTVAGLINEQATLLTRQSDGFLRDAEQKACKILVDAWAVNAGVNEADANSTNKLDDANLGAAITILKAGIS